MAGYSKWAEASPDETLAAVAARSLGTRLEAVREFLEKAATRADEDIEHVHQMRVWSRRAAAALRLYQALMPAWRVRRLEKHLKQIRRAANDARDDDVFAERLGRDRADRGADLLLDKVREHRRRVQTPIVAVFRKLTAEDRFARRAAKLLQRVGTKGRAEAGAVRFGDWAACRLHAECENFFQAAEGDLSDVDRLHRFRIAGKQLRYTMELLAAAFDDQLRTRVYPLIKDVQDRLGAINDHVTAQKSLERWIGEANSDAERIYLESRLQSEKEQTEKLRDEFLEWWNGSRETELRNALDEAMGTAAPDCQTVAG